MKMKVETYNISWNKLTSLDVFFLAIANDGSSHGDVTLERCNNVCCLLFLIPTDSGVEQQNSDNYTEIDPIAETSSE